MSNSMQHWNGNQLVVIDTETTGTDPNLHEIWQLCILPLDSNIEIRRDVAPLYIKMKPECPDLINWDIPVMKNNRPQISDAILRGLTQEAGRNIFFDWYKRLNLPYNKGGRDTCKIIPLGQNYSFDKGFIKAWLGFETYEEYFHYADRDTMVIANFMNDRAAMRAEKVPFSKTNLRWLANVLGVELLDRSAHDALNDCIACAAVYKRMVNYSFGRFA